MNRNEDANVREDPDLYRGAIKHRHLWIKSLVAVLANGKKNLLELFAQIHCTLV